MIYHIQLGQAMQMMYMLISKLEECLWQLRERKVCPLVMLYQELSKTMTSMSEEIWPEDIVPKNLMSPLLV